MPYTDRPETPAPPLDQIKERAREIKADMLANGTHRQRGQAGRKKPDRQAFESGVSRKVGRPRTSCSKDPAIAARYYAMAKIRKQRMKLRSSEGAGWYDELRARIGHQTIAESPTLRAWLGRDHG